MKNVRIKWPFWPSSWTYIFLGTLQLILFFVGIYLLLWIYRKILFSISNNSWPPSIEQLANGSQVIVAYAAIFAINQYALAYADRSDRKTKTVLEFVKFFRETVLEKGDETINKFGGNTKKLPVILLRKNTPALKFTESEFFKKISTNQKKPLDDYVEIIKKETEIEVMVRSCLNSAEEFAIGILNSDSQNHPAVSSIKKPFVDIIENLAIPLYYHIGITNDKFFYVSELYRQWKKDVGFIPRTPDDIQEKYDERQKKIRTII